MGLTIAPTGIQWGNQSGNATGLGYPSGSGSTMQWGSPTQYAPAAFDYSRFSPAQTPALSGPADQSLGGDMLSGGSGVATFSGGANMTADNLAPSAINTGVNADKVEQGWLGKNIGGLKDIASIVGSIGTVIGAFQQNKIAKDALNFQKSSYNTNLANQIKSYNLALEDRIRSRYAQKEMTSSSADAKIAENRL